MTTNEELNDLLADMRREWNSPTASLSIRSVLTRAITALAATVQQDGEPLWEKLPDGRVQMTEAGKKRWAADDGRSQQVAPAFIERRKRDGIEHGDGTPDYE